MITLSDLGGAQSVVRELARGLITRGHEVGVAARAGGPLWDTLDAQVRRFPLAKMRRQIAPLRDLAALLELRVLYRSFQPDVINLHSSKAGALGRVAFPAASVVYTVHGFDSIARAHRLFLPIEKALSRGSSRIVAVCEYDRRALAQHGIRASAVIRNGVADPSTAEPAEGPEVLEGLKRRYGFIAMSIARVSAPKRFDILVGAATLLQGDGIAVAWVGGIAGPHLALPENFALVAARPNAAALLRLADVVLLASDYEGLPISVLEALAWGRPVIASRVGGLTELVDDGINGFLVENEPAAFAAALLRLRGDAHLSNRMGIAARRRYEADFGLERMVDKYEKLYKDIAVTQSGR